jgi:hypothetical protein
LANAHEEGRFETDFGYRRMRVQVVYNQLDKEVITAKAVEKLPKLRSLVRLQNELRLLFLGG